MSWKKVKLGELCKIEKGAIGILKAIEGEYPLVTTGTDRKTHNEFQFDDEAVIIPLVSSTGHGHKSLKRIHFQTGKFALGSILCAVIPNDKNLLNPEYLYRFLDLNKENELVARMKGMANVTLPMKEIAEIEIPLPIIKEQIKFVEKYKVLEAKSNLLSTELNHQLILVKKLRQQFLQEAVQGKLLKNIEYENIIYPNIIDPPDKSGGNLNRGSLLKNNSKSRQFELSKSINFPKNKLHQSNNQPKAELPPSLDGGTGKDLLEQIKSQKAKLIQEKKIKADRELPPIKKEEIPFAIPENWAWCRLGEILIFGPTNGYSPVESKKGTGIKCLTLTATTSGIFKEEYFKLVDVEIPFSSSLWLMNNDILLQRGNSIDYVGIAAIYKGESNKFIYPDLMIKVRVPEMIKADYIHKILISPFNRKYFANNAFGAQKSMPKINQGVVLNTLIPLPPLAEQQRIVAKLEELMQTCNELEASIKQSVAYNERLLQQVLREALEPR